MAVRYLFLSLIVFFLIALIVAVVFAVSMSGKKQKDRSVNEIAADKNGAISDQSGIPKDKGGEKAAKEKLAENACVRSEQVINDMLSWLSDTESVKREIEYFYQKTGVQPYLLICDRLDGKGGEITDEEAENYLKGMYDTLYDDEGHMIFVFMEYAESEYVTFLYTGEAADRVIDSDAREIFLDNADYFYTDASLSDDAYFAKIFHDSAEGIMNN